VLVTDFVSTNIAQAVLTCINVRSKSTLDFAVFTGCSMPVIGCIAGPSFAKGMLAFVIALVHDDVTRREQESHGEKQAKD
jgi:hypothetical protein